jgi:hypothetical protein
MKNNRTGKASASGAGVLGGINNRQIDTYCNGGQLK